MKMHISNKLSFICLLILFSSQALFAQPPGYKPMKNGAAFKLKLNEISNKTNTIQSDFIQEKYLAMLSDKIESSGKFYFKKENQLRWEYATPFRYIIILNNDKVSIQDNNKTKQYDIGSNKTFREINDIMTGAVQGKLFQDETRYKPAFYENEKLYLIVLTPVDKSMKEFIKAIYLYFDKKSYAVTIIKMVEASDDYTIIKFNNRQQNINIPADKFMIK